MEAVAPSHDAVAVLRAIARAGFGYQRTKDLCHAARWKLIDDEIALGYVAFDMGLVPSESFPRRLVVEVRESSRPPRAFVPLFYFEEYDVHREPFDQAYWSLTEQLASILGPPSSSGEYTYPHRQGWPFFFSWWSLTDGAFVLVQDEFDIQFGMDVTLWVLPANAGLQNQTVSLFPLYYSSGGPVMKYRVLLEPDQDGVYVAEVPALPGCISQGRTRAKAVANIKEAIAAYLESLKAHGDPVPPSISEELVEVQE